jgi:chlorite dismutase
MALEAQSPIVAFVGGDHGAWRVSRATVLVGDPIAAVKRLDIQRGPARAEQGTWVLRGSVSHVRYTTRDESLKLTSKQEGLGRPEAVCGALIPIRKSAAWWALAQDERRAIYEERSRHTSIGLEYLPRIARKLHHSRDLGEPFDFLTWFEFAPDHEPAFDELLARLRGSEEWRYVDREIDLRVRLAG